MTYWQVLTLGGLAWIGEALAIVAVAVRWGDRQQRRDARRAWWP